MEVHMTAVVDLQARKIASEWHGGGGSALYVLASSGAIVRGVEAEIDDAIYVNGDDENNLAELSFLREYVDVKGHRGPQRGWGCLSW